MADPADDLYGLPLEEFTAARDAAARELRRAGDREAAAELAKLPKPTPAAWAANQLARNEPELIRAMLEAGDELREAQAEAVGGAGGAALREAAAAERHAVDAAMAGAAGFNPSGRPLSRAMADRLRATLHAAAADDEIREALAAGRLVAEAEARGARPLGAAPAPARPRRAERAQEAATKRRAGAKRGTQGGGAGGRPGATRRTEDREAAAERRAAEREAAARAAEARRAVEAELR